MAKFSGILGYVEFIETKSGVWKEVATEKPVSGDLMPNIRRLEQGASINDNMVLNNKFSIVADPYAHQHYFAIRYLKWKGAAWKVTNVEVLHPRLILTIGDVYHGATA